MAQSELSSIYIGASQFSVKHTHLTFHKYTVEITFYCITNERVSLRNFKLKLQEWLSLEHRQSLAGFNYDSCVPLHNSRVPNGIIVALLAKNDFSPDITS